MRISGAVPLGEHAGQGLGLGALHPRQDALKVLQGVHGRAADSDGHPLKPLLHRNGIHRLAQGAAVAHVGEHARLRRGRGGTGASDLRRSGVLTRRSSGSGRWGDALPRRW